MPSTLLTSFLGALQASLSVLLTIGYGVIATQFELIHEGPAKNVSTLCVKLFLPALLLTNIGSQLDQESAPRYVAIIIWALSYNILSILLGILCRKTLNFPRWVTPAITFNNTIAMPLLLLESLGKSGILEPLLWGPDDDISTALDRAKSYFLVNSMVSDTLTFGIGPKLLGVDELHDDSKLSELSEAAFTGGVVYEETALPGDGEDQDPVRNAQRETRDLEEEEEAIGANEETSLLPNKVVEVTTRMASRGGRLRRKYWNRLPQWVQVPLDWVGAFVSAPLVAAVIGVVIGLVPPLKTAFFAEQEDGGVFSAWLTESVKNIGDLFASLQIVIVGVKLCQSLKNMKHGEKSGPVPIIPTAFVLFIRFAVWPAISIPTIWAIASKTNLLDGDPMLAFSAMMMPCGPPALGIIALADVAGDDEDHIMSIAKFLTIAYAISPAMTFVVVGSLKATLATLAER